MLQNLLADRFKLAFHNDTRDLQAYVLTAGKSPKIKQSEGPGDTGCRGQLGGPGLTAMPGGGFMINQNAGPITNSFTCHSMTMEAFATFLRPQVSQNGSVNPVTDQTELKGAWDFDFKITLRLGMMNGGSTDGAITIFDAVDKQLGLKLTATKVPLQVLVVDSAQKPTPNAAGVTEAMAVEHPKEFDVADVKPNEPGEQVAGALEVLTSQFPFPLPTRSRGARWHDPYPRVPWRRMPRPSGPSGNRAAAFAPGLREGSVATGRRRAGETPLAQVHPLRQT